MSKLVLHQYAGSPFAEKVRCLLAYKQMSYDWVDIPVIMPKPDLMPSTGGYRKTPVMQIGADIYCDTALICRVINDLSPETNIYPEVQAANLAAMTHWTDTFFFKVSVAKVFQPKVLANHPLFSDPIASKAFVADRAALKGDSNEQPMALAEAEAFWLSHMQNLDLQLANQKYLFGDTPTIADFSTYHCLWFAYVNEVLRADFEPFQNVLAWRARMASMGSGEPKQISGADALGYAKDANSDCEVNISAGGFKAGDEVTVLPIDYGFQPVVGSLLQLTDSRIAVKRQDKKCGEVVVHFPRVGYKVE